MVNKEEKEQILFSHWSDIPLTKHMPEETYSEFAQESRDHIIEILRRGIEDNDQKVKGKIKRHALSVSEIKNLLKIEFNSTKSIQNVYFHINKLVELGFIQEVTIIKRGKHNITYYGRTAKLFLFNDKSGDSWKKEFENKVLPSLTQLINRLQNKDMSAEILNILDELMKSKMEIFDNVDKWIEKNSNILIELDTDIKMLYEIVMNASQVSEETVKINKKFLNLLKINKN